MTPFSTSPGLVYRQVCAAQPEFVQGDRELGMCENIGCMHASALAYWRQPTGLLHAGVQVHHTLVGCCAVWLAGMLHVGMTHDES
jgi:hypothetical protein